jgi:hypothetical protein
MIRFVIAFFLTPAFLVLMYYLGYSLLARGGAAPDAGAFAFGLFPFAYLATIVVWLPTVFFLERRALRLAKHYAMAGGALGLLADLLLLVAIRVESWEIEIFGLLVGFVMLGSAFSLLFWVIALWKTDGRLKMAG